MNESPPSRVEHPVGGVVALFGIRFFLPNTDVAQALTLPRLKASRVPQERLWASAYWWDLCLSHIQLVRSLSWMMSGLLDVGPCRFVWFV